MRDTPHTPPRKFTAAVAAKAVDESDRLSTAQPVAEETICAAERRLGRRFPPSYRWFLSTYGAGELSGGYELAGLAPFLYDEDVDDLAVPGDIVYLAGVNKERGFRPDTQLELLSLDGDEVYYFDVESVVDSGEWPVMVELAGNEEAEVYARDFYEFLWKISG